MAPSMAAMESSEITREETILTFLKKAGWESAVRHPIPGDASFRRYERLTKQDECAILMDAPPERENSRAYLNVQHYLRHAGFSVPHILCESVEDGLMLLEDFGNDSVSSRLREDASQESAIYADAVTLLAEMAAQGLTQLAPSGSHFPEYNDALLMQEVMLAAQWFLPEILPVGQVVEAVESYQKHWESVIAAADLSPQVITHRDYHADNLFLLSAKQGVARVGLLDFQDAVLGRPAYDLVSLLEDARRDVSAQVVEENLLRFCQLSGIDHSKFLQEYAFYGAQRNAKILGIFTRLYRRDGKSRYLGMVPRVWRYFDANLAHPSLAALKQWRDHYITPSVEARILHLEQHLTGGA